MINLTLLPPRAQGPSSAAPFHTWDFPDGTRWAAFYRREPGFLLRFPDLADFEIAGDVGCVTCTPAPDISSATTEHLYLNQILPLALSKLGKLVFHASAVELADGAIAFLAASGRGKSTLAASFAANGHRFLTDDSLVLEQRDGHYLVQPSHPSVRLWEDSEERLFSGSATTTQRLDYTSKLRVLAGSQVPHCDQPRRLISAYFLGDGYCAEGITLERLTEAETLIEWAKNSFLLDVEDRSLIGAHFDRLAVLANTLPCYRLDYPRRYEDLSRIRDTLQSHAGTSRPPA